MTLTVDAVYENGSLKIGQAVPLSDHQRVQVTIHIPVAVPQALQAVKVGYGLLPWTGDPETLRQVAEDDEFGILESR